MSATIKHMHCVYTLTKDDRKNLAIQLLNNLGKLARAFAWQLAS